MAVGMMVLPAAAARLWVRSVPALMALATVLALGASLVGLLLSYHVEWPTSPAIVLCLGAVYLASLVLGRNGLWRGGTRAARRHLQR